MHATRHRKALSALAVCSVAVLAPTAASAQDAGEKAITARQGFMQLVSWNAGPLFGMAKGDVAYDAASAAAAAANLDALTQVTFPALFFEGTSKDDRPGKTRALPDIWSKGGEFQAAFDQLAAAVDGVASAAEKGQPELAAAIGEMGKTCGNCHNNFRAKEF